MRQKHFNGTGVWWAIVASMAVCVWATAREAEGAAAPLEPVDRIVAVIDDDIITLRELQHLAEPHIQAESQGQAAAEAERSADGPGHRDDTQPAAPTNPARRQAILARVLEETIDERMVDRELKTSRERLGVGDKDVDRAIDEVMATNHLTREQLQAALYGQGLTWADYRQKLTHQIERARLMQYRVQGRVEVKGAEVQRRCEERGRAGRHDVAVCASHIVLRVAADASPDVRAAVRRRIEALRARLVAGADFVALAAQAFGEAGADGGPLGCFRRGEMVEAYDDVAFSLPLGAISSVFETEMGWHLLKVTDRQVAQPPTCDSPEALEPFRQEIYQQQMQLQMDAWVRELRSKAFVEVRL